MAHVRHRTESFTILPADRPGSFLVRLGERDQSHVDLVDPTRIEFPYVRLLADVVDRHGPPTAPLRVVHVGGAGLTLPRYVAATRPRSRQVVLEPHTALTEEVRRLLPLPPRSGISVRPVDGATGLAAVADAWADLVVVDAFEDGAVPVELTTPEHFAQVGRVLVAGGRLLLNLTDRAPFASTRDALAGLREALPELIVVVETATWRGRRPGNVVVVAGGPPPVDGLVPGMVDGLRAGLAGGSSYRLLVGREVSDALGGGRSPTRGSTPGHDKDVTPNGSGVTDVTDR